MVLGRETVLGRLERENASEEICIDRNMGGIASRHFHGDGIFQESVRVCRQSSRQSEKVREIQAGESQFQMR